MEDKRFCLEEKDILKLLNDVAFHPGEWQADEEMPGFLKARVRKNVRQEIRRKSRLQTAKRGSIAAAVLLALLIGLGMSPALAQSIPVVNSIFQLFNEKWGYYEAYIPFSQLVDKSVTDQGITLTINEALADDSTLIIGYTIHSERKLENLDGVVLLPFLTIDRGLPQGAGGSGEYVDDQTYVGVNHISYQSLSVSDQLQIDIKVEQIAGVHGRWDFSFTVSKGELEKRTSVFQVNNQVNLPEGPVTMDKVVFTPIDSTLYYSGNYQDPITRAMDAVVYWWFVFDDQGRDLQAGPASFGGNNAPPGKDFQGTVKFQAVEDLPPYLTVVPCRFPVSSGQDAAAALKPAESLQVLDGNYPLELSQGKMGKLIIRNIQTADGKTVVHFTAEGKAPCFQAGNFYLKDAAGEFIHPQYGMRRDEEHPNNFTAVFPALEAGKQYSAGTSQLTGIDLMEDLRFKIELQS